MFIPRFVSGELMEIVEIRDLDGPNLFMLTPAIKLELAVVADDVPQVSTIADAFVVGEALPAEITLESADLSRVKVLLAETVNRLHDRCDVARPNEIVRDMETPGHVVVAYAWERRAFAVALGRLAIDIVLGQVDAAAIEDRISQLRDKLAAPPDEDDAPEYIRRSACRVPIVAITGTNGKTTTTRLISSILMTAGRRVGWTSSSGVYIQGEERVHGDYTGPSGAASVLNDPSVEVAVLETARGGILLRGIGYEANDVSVVTNISADHLGTQGVLSVEGLAEVKSLVARVTKPDGFAVLNSDDPLVLAMRLQVMAKPFLVTRQAEPDEVVTMHIASGGWALTVADGLIHWHHDGQDDVLAALSDVPVTFGGRAGHMVENALCAAAACLGLGLPLDQVREGLSAFRPHADQNRGRLNVFDLHGVTVIIDFAHNEAGLRHLLQFGRSFATAADARLIAIVGTAGDRPDAVFRSIGRMAAEQADAVVVKDSTRYLRGREPGEMIALMREGVAEAQGDSRPSAASERAGVEQGIDMAKPGDVVAVMCIEDYDEILPWLEREGTSIG